ncbi:MAG: glucosylceramidase [Calditrichaeota bacterium]|nr:MAG: glucosylceramidase [Calditrichota bacterium]
MKVQQNKSLISVYRTAKDTGEKLTLLEPIFLKPMRHMDALFPSITIDPSITFQVIEGFGGSFTDAAAMTFYGLPQKAQNEMMTRYFDVEDGIGYSMCKTHINSCDFSEETYCYTQIADDIMLETFSIQHDKKYRIPFIQEAMKVARSQIKIFVTPWSPPAWMKTNNDMLHGGKLKPEYYPTWADYLVRFIQEYEKEGLSIWGLAVQNETEAAQIWESCVYSAEEERDFVRDFLGPTLRGKGMPHIRIVIWDHNRALMYHRAKTIYDDSEAAKYVWGTGFHWYYGDHFDNVRLVHEAFPDKNLLFTEGCVYPFDQSKLSEWHWGERYAKSMIMDLNNWTAGWIDWNLLLNEYGGPNHVANYCFAPIIADTRSGELFYMNSYYYIGHFSKFIRPGAKRIVCTLNSDSLLATAFINPNGKIAIVVLNLTEKNVEFQLSFITEGAYLISTARSIMTILY